MKILKENQMLLLFGFNFMFITELYAYGYNFHYIIDEELNVGSIIGELKKDFLQKHNKRELLIDAASLKFYLSPSSRYHNNYFHLDNTTGILYNKEIFDREVLCKPGGSIPMCCFTIIVQVTPKKHFAILRIVVEIKDINDNSPKFPISKYNFQISDQTKYGQSFQIPAARDDDADDYGVNNYFIREEKSDQIFLDIFKLINHKMADGSFDIRLEVKNKNLVNNTKFKSISGEIMVVDKGIPPLSDVLCIVVNINKTHDTDSHFEIPLYRFFVTENSDVGTIIGLVKSKAMSESLHYFIQDNSSKFRQLPFKINSNSGEIYVNGSVDYERDKSFRFNVVVLPLNPFDSASVTVDVLVIDVNDSSPKISINTLTPNNIAQLKENSPEGTLIALVHVSDEDSDISDKPICYTQSSYFVLDIINISMHIQEYKLLSAVSFDREELSRYDVEIICEELDNTYLNSRIMVFVNIIDENDNSPFFAQTTYIVDLCENTQSGLTPLIKFQASDIDEGQNAVLTYHLSSLHSNSTYAYFFYIDELDGIVYSQHRFDYENDQQCFVFVIRAVDSGETKLTGTTTLTLNIVDVNDNSPLFHQNIFEFEVLRSEVSEGIVIGTINSYDYDKSPENSKIIYTIDGAPQNRYFNIDPSSGELSWTKTPTDESKFEFNVTASNSFSQHVLDASVLVIIRIHDVSGIIIANPIVESDVHVFTGPVYKGSPIFQVKVKNSDIIKPRFQFISGHDKNEFEIDPKSGIIMATKETEKGLSFFNFTLLIVDEDMNFEQTISQLPIFVNNTGDQDNFVRIWVQNSDNVALSLVCIIVTVVLTLIITSLLLIMKNKRTRKSERIKANDLEATRNIIVVPNFYESSSDLVKNESLPKGINFSISNLKGEKESGLYHDNRNLYKIVHSDVTCDPWAICSKLTDESIRNEDTFLLDSGKGDISQSLNKNRKLFRDIKNNFSQPINRESHHARFSSMCLVNSILAPLELTLHKFTSNEELKENCELCRIDQKRKKTESNGVTIMTTV